MKRLIISLLILLNSIFSSNIFACGSFVTSDDVSIRILKLSGLNISGYNAFTYSYGYFTHDEPEAEKLGKLRNLNLWKKRCKDIPNIQDINQVIYSDNITILTKKTKNSFVRYLYSVKDIEAIDYIKFAKKISVYNKTISEDDPWETGGNINIPQRAEFIEEALKKAAATYDNDLKIRYAFLAIRLAYYDNSTSQVETIYDEYFKKRKRKNIIDYWGMYFRTIIEENQSAYRNYLASLVFANAEDKRNMVNYEYSKYKNDDYNSTNDETYIKETLSYARNNNEKAAVWLLEGIKTYGKALHCIKKLHQICPKDIGLNILLFREVSKLEDWIFTPYYSKFTAGDYEMSPITVPIGGDENKIRFKIDKKYAKQLLQFVQSVDLNNVSNPLVWDISKADLFFITGAYDKSIHLIDSLNSRYIKNSEFISQLNRIKAMCLVAKQTTDSAIIPEEVKPILMYESSKQNSDFLFIIAKELEYKHNSTDAAILFSTFDNAYGKIWKADKEVQTLQEDYYSDSFHYMDAVYSTKQVQNVITEIENNPQTDAFSRWKLTSIKKDKSRLYDLLGTKYLRQNLLEKALITFKNVNKKLWASYNYKTMLNANPFYTNMYNEHTKTDADTITFTKVTLIGRLIQYLNKANSLKTRNRSYYYFLVANCYLNMSYYGNSWYMKRYFWSVSRVGFGMEDDRDYFNCDKAKNYYALAKKTSKNQKFAALCLRMMARCDSYSNKSEPIYNQLEKQYPNDYNELAGNCLSFETYFKMHD